MQAWTKPGPFTFNGRYNQLRYVNPWPKPLQKPHPPVWLAGGGSVETWELAATHDYTYSYLSFFGYQFAKKLMGGFWETMDRMGIDQNPYRAGFAQQICVSETDERAEQEYLEHVTYFFKKCLHIPPYFFEAPGYRTRRSTEFAIKTDQPGERAKVLTLEKSWKGLVDNGFIIAGSPATVADRLIEAAKTLRFGNLHALLQIGSMPHDLTEKNITLFAEEVIPRIKNLWADDGWKHEWWPIGAADRTTD
jgi:alkanesulfonate monooxygenase SsuD/methylene tetrahydromethanopterin reductase-like flavin-dependent oxidoreductase (luciferase family)